MVSLAVPVSHAEKPNVSQKPNVVVQVNLAAKPSVKPIQKLKLNVAVPDNLAVNFAERQRPLRKLLRKPSQKPNVVVLDNPVERQSEMHMRSHMLQMLHSPNFKRLRPDTSHRP